MTQLRNYLDMNSLRQMSARYLDVNLERSESRHNVARYVHEELEKCLAPPCDEMHPLRTFFDLPRIKEVDVDIGMMTDKLSPKHILVKEDAKQDSASKLANFDDDLKEVEGKEEANGKNEQHPDPKNSAADALPEDSKK